VYFKEIADLNPECQTRLQCVWPEVAGSGGTAEESVRIICGSARDLEVDMKAGRMREDLYYRMSGVCLRLPPVRQRREDIPVLLRHFLGKYSEEFGREIPRLSAETERLFQEYAWPGNLDEMEYAAKVLVVLGNEKLAMGGLRALLEKSETESVVGMSLKAASRAASQEAEKNLILKALDRTRWNRRRAARELQISYKALLYKLKRIQCQGYGTS
jgi:two-component system, NtrC family, response regulator AtoC